MDRLLKPERLDTDTNSSSASKEWTHWLKTFQNFMSVLPTEGLNKLCVLTNYVTPKIYESFAECATYDEAIQTLEALFVKPTNEIFARHRLATRCQHAGETLDEYLQALKTLSKDCNFKSVTAALHREESIRDAFISGLQSSLIRQRLLENKTLDLAAIFDQARSLDLAQQNSELYMAPPVPSFSASACEHKSVLGLDSPNRTFGSAAANSKCFFCGNARHPRSKCPAREATCNKCHKKGHFAKVCRSEPFSTVSTSACTNRPTIASVTGPSALSKAMCKIDIQGLEVGGLIDSGSIDSFIHPDLVRQGCITTYPSDNVISMASASLSTKSLGFCTVNLKIKGRDYHNVRLYVLPQLCVDIILGQDFQQQHDSVTIEYGGNQPPLLLSLTTLCVDPPELFANLTDDCRPIASMSRRYSFDDRKFIANETQRLLREGIIEPSNSP